MYLPNFPTMPINGYRHDLGPEGGPHMPRVYVAGNINSQASESLLESGLVLTSDPDDATVNIVRSDGDYSPAALEKKQQLKLIVRAGVEFGDLINMNEAQQRGILTMNTPGPSTEAVQRHTLALIGDYRQGTTRNTMMLLNHEQWNRGKPWAKPVEKKQTVGVVGFGRIGQNVGEATLQQGIADNVVFYDAYPKTITGAHQHRIRPLPLEGVIEQAQILTLHVSGVQEAVRRELVTKMGNIKLLVNTARAGVIAPETVLEYLERYPDAMYASDVWPDEKDMAKGKRGMFDREVIRKILKIGREEGRVIATPHIASSGEKTEEANGLEAAARTKEFLKNGVTSRLGAVGPTPILETPWTNGSGHRLMFAHGNHKGALLAIMESAKGVNIGDNHNASVTSGQFRDLALTHVDFYDHDGVTADDVLEIGRKAEASLGKNLQWRRTMRFEPLADSAESDEL